MTGREGESGRKGCMTYIIIDKVGPCICDSEESLDRYLDVPDEVAELEFFKC